VSAHSEAIGRASGSRRTKDRAFRLGMFVCLGLAIGLLAVLLVDVAADGAGRLNWDFVTSFTSIDTDQAGIQAALWGTIWLMGVCALFIIPVGVATAIYLEEYADDTKWWNRLIEVNIQNLAAVPSIVYGILGLAFIVRGPAGLGFVLLSGALILTLLVLPIVIVSAREAIRAVPDSIRQGAYALGATQWQVIRRQVLPAAIPGIATGSILALSRAIGETAPLIMIGAVTYISFDPSILGPFTALPIQIYSFLRLPQEEFKLLAAASIIVLLAILLTLNAFAIFIRNRYRRSW
jgi:phosphate transport system permease protein